MRLDTALEGYWLARKRDFSPATVKDYTRTFTRLIGHLGPDHPIEQITPAHIHTFLDAEAARGLSPKTLLNLWIALSSLWTWTETALHLPHIIRSGVPRPKAKQRAIQPYTQAEVRALLSACDTAAGWDSVNGRRVHAKRPTALRDKTILLLLLDAGLRVSELCDLHIADYNQKRGQIHIRHGKGDKARILFIGETTRQSLWHYIHTQRQAAPPSDHLFVTSTGTPHDRYNIRRIISRAGDRCGVPAATPHRFRHTFGINFLRNGGNLLELKELLGHSSLSTVQIYAKLAAIDLETAQRRHSVADRWGL